jgi:hypothetical protein
MKSMAVPSSSIDWASGTALYGPEAVQAWVALVQVKVLSDRHDEGGGQAYLVRFRPPAGKLIKIDRRGRALRSPGELAVVERRAA